MFMCLTAAAFSACGDDDSDKNFGSGDDTDFTPTELVVKGQVEKGPFVSGSTIDMQPLSYEMKAVGSTYSATITDDAGSFTFSPEKFEQSYARLSVTGYFYNEYQGKLSNGTIMLQGIVDLRDKATVNVNLLTHLKYQRLLNLIATGQPYRSANAQAQEELLKAFGLQQYNTIDASQFSVAAGTDEAAALIVFSSLLLGDRTEAEFTEYLAKLCADFADDGQFTDANKEQISTDRDALFDKLENIRQHLIDRYEQLGRNIEVKPLAGYADWDDNGVAGDEAHDPSKPINLSKDYIQVPTEGGSYEVTFNSDVPLYLTPRSSNESAVMANETLSTVGFTSCTTEIRNNQTLLITVKPAEYRNMYDYNIYLYDGLDNVVGTIRLSQKGKPDGKFLSGDGTELFERIANKLTNDPEQTLLRELDNRINRLAQMNSSYPMPDVTEYHLDDVLRVYRALAALISGTPYIPSMSLGAITTTDLIPELAQAIDNLPEHAVGNCETPEQIAWLSADIARFALAMIYEENGQHIDARTLLQKIVDNNFYSEDNPVILSFYGRSSIIDYHMVLEYLQYLGTR